MLVAGGPTMLRRRWVLVGVAWVIAATLVILLLPNRTPPVLAIPADEEVVEVRASIRESEFGFGPTPEFVVPAEHVSIILGHLRPPEYMRKNWNLEWLTEVGYVVVRSRDGRELKVRFFEAGHNPAVFTVDGANQFYGWSDPNAKDVGGTPAVQDGGIVLGLAIEKAFMAFKISKLKASQK